MKIDLVGPHRRGLAMGLNEAANHGRDGDELSGRDIVIRTSFTEKAARHP
jgi:hypothetical protein